jgi:hypothetical protein
VINVESIRTAVLRAPPGSVLIVGRFLVPIRTLFLFLGLNVVKLKERAAPMRTQHLIPPQENPISLPKKPPFPSPRKPRFPPKEGETYSVCR